MSKYGVVCILEMSVEGDNLRDARRIVEDAIYEAFDNKAAKDCNPLIGRTQIITGAESIIMYGKVR